VGLDGYARKGNHRFSCSDKWVYKGKRIMSGPLVGLNINNWVNHCNFRANHSGRRKITSVGIIGKNFDNVPLGAHEGTIDGQTILK
jgi:hypothetical protein